ncbi:tRNA (adenosine(37)-N6)-threonylcarbamoyltransferase complex ATPase subunit type 1 TsaE [Candidatus Microgenomates bacterium]|nr:tRNA (adenosine(37)-N6)-threonylcarbamoyltransferase complex ATPase subunit type 1 TsaE [Candidatus Microgenomates bacterium]
MKIITKSGSETQKAGEDLALHLRGVSVIALTGELGTGKTTFVQGLARGLGIKQRIISPTFILMRQYELKVQNSKVKTTTQKSKLKYLYHIDLYRLEGDLSQEIKNLGMDDLWGKPENIVVIEWADKIRELLPDNTTWIKFEVLDDDTHRIIY